MREKMLRTLAAASVAAALATQAAGAAKPQPQVKCGATCAAPVARAKAPAASKPTKPPQKALPKLLDLGATTCTPCKMMTPILDDLEKKYKGKLQVEFINVREKPEAAEKYHVRLIPTQIFFDARGKEFARHTGFYPKEDIMAEFKKQGIDLDKPAPKTKPSTGAKPPAKGKGG